MNQQLTEDDPLTIPCEFCDDGYNHNGGNDVKCDRCKGSGLESTSSLCIYGYENCNEEEGYCELHQKENEA